MKCVICKHGETEPSTTTLTLEREGAVVAFKEALLITKWLLKLVSQLLMA